MVPLCHLSFVLYEQVKFRPKTKVKMKLSHSVVAVGTVCVCGGGGEEWCQALHEFNLCNFFNLISFTIFKYSLVIFNNLK